MVPLQAAQKISIHALREEGDPGPRVAIIKNCRFQSTPSARRATAAQADLSAGQGISIHALREEGDHAAPEPGLLE